MFDIKLTGNSAFHWTKTENAMFIGYCFDEKNLLLTDFKAIDYILDNHKDGFTANGIYSLIYFQEDKLEILTDNINFFPIFFSYIKNTWLVSDSWYKIVREKETFMPNKDSETEFLSAGFVLENDTLDLSIKKTRAGEKIILSATGEFESKPYWFFIPESQISGDLNELIDLATTNINQAAKRMIKFLNGRTAVLPLSGGFDSRLIACMLKSQNYEDVICFTYGKLNPEVEISKKVAHNLGYKWYFVDYAKNNNDDFYKTDDFIKYIELAGNGYSMPYLQEYFAVKELKDKNIIPENSVFLPGHSGDFLGGSYIEKTVKTEIQNTYLAKYISQKYFTFSIPKNKSLLENRINASISDYPAKNNVSPKYNPYIEDWDIKEKLAKFIFHSSTVFNHFGYQHYFPLWDKHIILFFRNISFELREKKVLYDKVLTLKYFKPLNVFFEAKELSKSNTYKKYQKIKDKTRNLFPWKYVLARMKKHDWMNYSRYCETLEDDMKKHGYKKLKRYKFFNVVICKWYLFQTGYYNQQKL